MHCFARSRWGCNPQNMFPERERFTQTKRHWACRSSMRRSDTLAARNMYNVVRLREAAVPARGRIFFAPVMTFISLHLRRCLSRVSLARQGCQRRCRCFDAKSVIQAPSLPLSLPARVCRISEQKRRRWVDSSLMDAASKKRKRIAAPQSAKASRI